MALSIFPAFAEEQVFISICVRCGQNQQTARFQPMCHGAHQVCRHAAGNVLHYMTGQNDAVFFSFRQNTCISMIYMYRTSAFPAYTFCFCLCSLTAFRIRLCCRDTVCFLCKYSEKTSHTASQIQQIYSLSSCFFLFHETVHRFHCLAEYFIFTFAPVCTIKFCIYELTGQLVFFIWICICHGYASLSGLVYPYSSVYHKFLFSKIPNRTQIQKTENPGSSLR